jgi:hypothetical protein
VKGDLEGKNKLQSKQSFIKKSYESIRNRPINFSNLKSLSQSESDEETNKFLYSDTSKYFRKIKKKAKS